MKPTRARYWVIVFAVTLAVLSYIDRVAISQAAPSITKDLGLSKDQNGDDLRRVRSYLYSLSSKCRADGFGDSMGPRSVLVRIVIAWSSFTALTGASMEFHFTVGDPILFRRG